ncbi:tetratricopeptide repeat protein [Dyella sp.]|jgi:predicted negative regulator of RcsB-dependent stress response|uniref:YfgM family protein n=1 Tax=Dyella sp. TaxID=1869338 RepID=UPI002D796495|nr:tetratricopeptide repeat protein [Dyella sp.]HET6432857.1 tetratricopeptide repeat protein [Dyella sp.]
MAFDAYDDYEQSELVQKWLRQNGVSIIVGIAIGLIGIFGWQQWRNHQASNRAQAAQVYQQIQSAEAAGNTAMADQLVERLQTEHEKSAYAVFATSERARRQVAAKEYDKAAGSLGWALAHAEDPALKGLTQLRMAQVQFAQGKAKEALATLDQLGDAQYRGLSQELRGDVLVNLGRVDDARKAYQSALSALSGDAPQRSSLQLKIDDLAAAGKQGA